MDSFRQDVLFAVRAMARNGVAAAVMLLTLAIGIGANTAMFTIVDAVLVRSLPYKDPDRLVAVWMHPREQPDQKMFGAYRDFEDLRAQADSFEDVAANTWAVGGRTLMWRGEPHFVTAIPSSDNLFSVLGAHAARGRVFEPADLGNGCTVVLADRFWRGELGGEPSIVGQSITLDSESCTVIGVMPAAFEFFPKATQVWTLITPGGPPTRGPLASVAIFGRLKAGVSPQSALAETAATHQRVLSELPADSFLRDTVLGVYSLKDEFTFLAGPNLRGALLMLSAAVGAVLLICCVNVAGLLLGRGTERQKELAIRAALGCGRARIMRQLLTESMVLGMAGAAVGAAIAVVAVRWFQAVNAIELPAGSTVTLDWRVLAFTTVIGLIAAVLFGVVPALQASRIQPNDALKGMTRNRSPQWFRRGGGVLAIVQLSASMVLLVSAGLLLRSVDRLTSVPLSFRTERLLTASVTLPEGAYAETAQQSAFYASALRRVAALPGVENAAVTSNMPLVGGQVGRAVTVAGKPGPGSEIGDVGLEHVSDTFLRVMDIPLLRGREFDSRDAGDAQPVAIVNQQFADKYFAGEDPVGQRIKLGMETSAGPWLTIVGVAQNVERANFFNEMSLDAPPVVYRPASQAIGRTMTLLVRTTSDVASAGPMIQREIKALDTRVPLYAVDTMEHIVARNFAQPRLRTELLGFFAGLAVLLAAIGVYGLLTRAVARQTRELGIRMAFGAGRARILWSTMRQGLLLTGIGIVVGLAAAIYFARFLGSMLYGVEKTDLLTTCASAAILILSAVVATYIPARRASLVDPMRSLRAD